MVRVTQSPQPPHVSGTSGQNVDVPVQIPGETDPSRLVWAQVAQINEFLTAKDRLRKSLGAAPKTRVLFTGENLDRLVPRPWGKRPELRRYRDVMTAMNRAHQKMQILNSMPMISFAGISFDSVQEMQAFPEDFQILMETITALLEVDAALKKFEKTSKAGPTTAALRLEYLFYAHELVNFAAIAGQLSPEEERAEKEKTFPGRKKTAPDREGAEAVLNALEEDARDLFARLDMLTEQKNTAPSKEFRQSLQEIKKLLAAFKTKIDAQIAMDDGDDHGFGWENEAGMSGILGDPRFQVIESAFEQVSLRLEALTSPDLFLPLFHMLDQLVPHIPEPLIEAGALLPSDGPGLKTALEEAGIVRGEVLGRLQRYETGAIETLLRKLLADFSVQSRLLVNLLPLLDGLIKRISVENGLTDRLRAERKAYSGEYPEDDAEQGAYSGDYPEDGAEQGAYPGEYPEDGAEQEAYSGDYPEDGAEQGAYSRDYPEDNAEQEDYPGEYPEDDAEQEAYSGEYPEDGAEQGAYSGDYPEDDAEQEAYSGDYPEDGAEQEAYSGGFPEAGRRIHRSDLIRALNPLYGWPADVEDILDTLLEYLEEHEELYDSIPELSEKLQNSFFALSPELAEASLDRFLGMISAMGNAQHMRPVYIQKAFHTRLSLTAIVTAALQNIDPAYLVAATDEERLLSARKMGPLSSAVLCRYEEEDGTESILVFRPEESARRNLEALLVSSPGFSPEERMMPLSIAVSKVAELLDCQNLMAKSFIGALEGQLGIFTDFVKGSTAGQLKNGAPFGTVEGREVGLPEALSLLDAAGLLSVFQGELLRQLCMLEWLDLLTGCMDRHADNYIVSGDLSTGEVSVTVLDNCAVFGRRIVGPALIKLDPADMSPAMKALVRDLRQAGVPMPGGVLDLTAVPPELLPRVRQVCGFNQAGRPRMIDHKQFTKLMAITDENLREILSPLLNPSSVEAAVTRLQNARKLALELERNNLVIRDWQESGILELELEKRIPAGSPPVLAAFDGLFVRDLLCNPPAGRKSGEVRQGPGAAP